MRRCRRGDLGGLTTTSIPWRKSHRPGAQHRQVGPHRDRRLSRKITVTCAVKSAAEETSNTMVDQLRSFARRSDARGPQVGTDGRLGGQACSRRRRNLEGLTDNVNLLAAISPPKCATIAM